MKVLLTIISLMVIITILSVKADHFVVGNVANRVKLAKHELVEYNAIPFKKRVKYYFYSQPDQRVIQGIQALENFHTKASINITAGGVGHPFVNLRLKSERGSGMSYDIGIYVNEDYVSNI